MRRHTVCLILGLVAFVTAMQAANGAESVVKVFADRTEPVYKCGETATFTIKVTRADKPVTKGNVTVVLSLDGGRNITQQVVALGQKTAAVSGTLEEPGFLWCAATMRVNGPTLRGCASAAFEPERMETAAILPDDFDAFWAEGQARVDAIPMDLQLTPLPEYSDDKQESFKISLANIDNTRIYGYLSVPKGRKGPYPAIVSVPGVGVGDPRSPNTEYAAAGSLSLYMGVHTHDLGLPQEEYAKLRAGPLAAYSHIGAPDREKYFFRRAILGIDRAVRYVTSRPDWDGEHLVYCGTSQGGGMGLILAGLNPTFNAAAVNIPSLCEHNAQRVGRGPNGVQLLVHAPAARKDEYAKMADYFDAVNFARKIRCPVIMSVGFLDTSCPPWSVYAAYNVIESPKQMFHGYRSGHRTPRAFMERLGPWLDGQLGRTNPIPPMLGAEDEEWTDSDSKRSAPMKALIIGNSQISSNDLPRMIEELTASAPETAPRIEIGRGIVDGASLKKCWDKGTGEAAPRGMIASQKWDYVIIQEIFCADKAEFEEYAAKFDDEITKAGSKTLLFATANTSRYYSPQYTYPHSFEWLNNMQIEFGQKHNIPVAAAGFAWMKYLGSDPTEADRLDLYAEDKGHPGIKGSYIYACLLYAHITGYNPELLPLPEKGLVSRGKTAITKQEMAKMRKAAWAQYQEDTGGE